MMSRQAYFYRVPPQELHRRNQLQADPANTRTLQTIDMKVGKETSNPVSIFQLTLFRNKIRYRCNRGVLQLKDFVFLYMLR